MKISTMSVVEFFKDKRVLITGGSGFIGKVLIEKILWTFEIGEIYVLLREKKGKTAEERLKAITENSLFNRLRNQKPEAFKKLVPICGDVKECKLGLNEDDRRTIIDNVNIVYHSAASVRFDDFLKDAILLNTRGTREVVALASQIRNLVAFIHISTSYCNIDNKIVEEKIYPPHADWRSAIRVAEEISQRTLDVLSLKYIEPLPNTYTFSKSLAEHVVDDMCRGKMPAAIIRPSVVINTVGEPFSGWTDNVNGPIGLLIAGGKGILRITYGDPNSGQDFIPVDKTAKIIILATFERALNSDWNEVQVYNATRGNENIFGNKDIIDMGMHLVWNAPATNLFWYPSCFMTDNWYLFYIIYIIYCILPALLVDGILKLTGQKTMLIKIIRKIYIANMALTPFLFNTWSFVNDKTRSLSSKVLENETNLFYFNEIFQVSKEESYVYYFKGKIGTMKELFKEEFNLDRGLRCTRIMWLLDRILQLMVCGAFCWCLLVKTDVFHFLNNKVDDLLLFLSNL